MVFSIKRHEFRQFTQKAGALTKKVGGQKYGVSGLCNKSQELEAVLMEYVERFGLTEAARKYFDSRATNESENGNR